jgi:hypothetical protein
MKSLFTVFLITLCSAFCSAQSRIPNLFFDYWDHFPEKVVGSQTYPEFYQPAPGTFWTTSNQGTRTIPFNPTALRTTDNYAAVGEESQYAVLLKSTSFPFGIAAGSLIAGTYVGGTNPDKAIKMGQPFQGRPERMVGYYKYIPINNDYCKAYAVLTRWNGSKQDTVATAEFDQTMRTTTVTSYTQFDIPFDYKSSADPDSVQIVFTASGDGNNFKGGNGSEFYLDYFQLLYPGETSISEQNPDKKLHVFPNPVKDVVQIWLPSETNPEGTLTLSDLNGKVLLTRSLNHTVNHVDLSNLESGYYIVSIENQGDLVYSGRLNKL